MTSKRLLIPNLCRIRKQPQSSTAVYILGNALYPRINVISSGQGPGDADDDGHNNLVTNNSNMHHIRTYTVNPSTDPPTPLPYPHLFNIKQFSKNPFGLRLSNSLGAHVTHISHNNITKYINETDIIPILCVMCVLQF